LAHLIQTNNPVVVPHYPTIISILLRMLLQISKNLPGFVEADKPIIASQVSELLRGFSGRYPTEMNMLFLTFQADEQTALKAFL
jgi:hypothetical protein